MGVPARGGQSRSSVSAMQSPVLPEYSDESWMGPCVAGRVRARSSVGRPFCRPSSSEAEIRDVRRSVCY